MVWCMAVKAGRYPVVVNDAPGSLLSRILAAQLLEALHLLGAGFDPSAIEAAALDFGMSAGPLHYLDDIGLVNACGFFRGLAAAFGERGARWLLVGGAAALMALIVWLIW